MRKTIGEVRNGVKSKAASMKQTDRLLREAVDKRYERRLAHDYFVRFHMSLILAAVTASGVLASKGLLELGVHSLRLRYPVAVLVSYLVFLLLVRLWIWYVSLRSGAIAGIQNLNAGKSGGGGSWDGSLGFGSGSSGGGGGGVSEGFARFGGGSSGGGGASDVWEPNAPVAFVSEPAPSPSTSSGWFPKLDFDFDFDGDGGFVLVLLALLVVGILGAGGYLVYAAPQILPEAAWQALLAGTLTRISKEEHHDWMSGVLRSTWIPFAIVLILAAFLGWEAHHYCPAAPRLIDVFHCAIPRT